MRCQMIRQGIGTRKRSRTILAYVRAFLRVRTHMHLQVGIGGERPGTYLAHVRFDTVVSAQVRYQRRRLCEALAADLAKESLRAVSFLALLKSAIVLG